MLQSEHLKLSPQDLQSSLVTVVRRDLKPPNSLSPTIFQTLSEECSAVLTNLGFLVQIFIRSKALQEQPALSQAVIWVETNMEEVLHQLTRP